MKFICDEKQCARRGKGARWHCKSCGVDYCLTCYPESAFVDEGTTTTTAVSVETGDDVMLEEEEEEERRDCQYDESALLEIPVHLDQTDFRPTWYHDTSHIPKESHNVYFKKKNKNDHHHSKKKNRRGR